MPPEPLPWDRKDFFKERKHDRSEVLSGGPRWKEPTPHHHYTSSRWIPDIRSRGPPGVFYLLFSALLDLGFLLVFTPSNGQLVVT